MSKTIFAIAAHPDDIEFLMAGTLLRLREAGCQNHYMNVANGCCGSATLDAATTAAVRRGEARAAAEILGATWHASLVDDLAIFYNAPSVARLCAVVREVKPDILLVQSPSDYMEDHQNTVRLAVTAAFCRGIPNFKTNPEVAPTRQDVVVYHAAPHGNRDPLRRLVRSELYIDIGPQMAAKQKALACHASQKEWLDHTQGMDSYLATMAALSRETGSLSKRYEYAEGWRRHNHLGLASADTDPLFEILSGHAFRDPEYALGLETK